MAFTGSNPYTRLTRLAEGTPCQLDADDARALHRLSAWMTAFAVKRREGAAPPSPKRPSLTDAYYMVSFFQQLSRKRLPARQWSDVNTLFDEVRRCAPAAAVCD